MNYSLESAFNSGENDNYAFKTLSKWAGMIIKKLHVIIVLKHLLLMKMENWRSRQLLQQQ